MFSVLVIRLRSLRLLRVSGIVMRLRMFLLLITFLKASHSFRNRLLVICKNAYLFATMIMTSVSSPFSCCSGIVRLNLMLATEGLTKRSAVGFLLRSLIMFQTFISRHNSNFFSDKLVLTSVTPASSAPVLQTPKATSSTLYFDSLTVNAGNGGFLHCIQMDTSVNAANQVVSVGADIAFDADPKFFACLVRFESSSVPTTLPTAYDVYPLDGRHDGGYYTVKDCVTIDVLPRTPGNNVYVGFMVWSNFTATKCRGLVSLNQVIKEIICLQPLRRGDLCLVLLLSVLLLLLLVAPCLNCLEAVKKPPPVAFKVMCLLPITIL